MSVSGIGHAPIEPSEGPEPSPAPEAPSASEASGNTGATRLPVTEGPPPDVRGRMLADTLGTAGEAGRWLTNPWTGALEPVRPLELDASGKVQTEDAVVRGSRNHHVFEAEAGQSLHVEIASQQDNAVFEIHRKGSEEPLAGTGAELRACTLRLPEAGAYEIVVGSIRGNANYQLALELK